MKWDSRIPTQTHVTAPWAHILFSKHMPGHPSRRTLHTTGADVSKQMGESRESSREPENRETPQPASGQCGHWGSPSHQRSPSHTRSPGAGRLTRRVPETTTSASHSGSANIYFTCTFNKIFFPGGSDSKESACNARRPGFDPWVRNIPWRKEWLPTLVILPTETYRQRSPAGYFTCTFNKPIIRVSPPSKLKQ